jgi:hypothetical protein
MRYKPAANRPPTTKESRKNITASLLLEGEKNKQSCSQHHQIHAQVEEKNRSKLAQKGDGIG